MINLQQVDPGFRTDDILTSRLDLNFTKYGDPFGERAPFWERLEERLRAIPGVVSVGGAGTFPLNEEGPFSTSMTIEGVHLPSNAPPQVDVRIVSPDYFQTLGQPLLAGSGIRSLGSWSRQPGRHRQSDDGAALLGRRQPGRHDGSRRMRGAHG